MNSTRKFIFAIVGLIVVTAIAGGIYKDRIDHQRQLRQAGVLLDQGIKEFREEKYQAALQTLDSIPDDAVEDWRIPYYAGSTLIKLKDYKAAAPRLETALSLKHDEHILFALGVAYYKLGNISLSKGYFASVLEINPDNEQAKGLMDVMAKLERYSSANETEPGNNQP